MHGSNNRNPPNKTLNKYKLKRCLGVLHPTLKSVSRRLERALKKKEKIVFPLADGALVWLQFCSS